MKVILTNRNPIKGEGMESRNEDVETLVGLGLTVLQARVYIALAKLGISTARTTAKAAKVAPGDVYRVLREIEEKGLAEKIIAKPTMYKATAIKEGLSILLQDKKEQYIKAEKLAKMMSDDFYENNSQNFLNEDLQFLITSKLVLLRKEHEKMANATQKSIDTMLKMEVNEKMFYREFPYIDDAMKRGVKIRIIAQELEEDAKSRKPNPLPKNSLIELRYLPETLIPFCGMHIFDRQEMTMALSAKEPMPSLRTNNPGVVELAETYFEKMWMRARKDSG